MFELLPVPHNGKVAAKLDLILQEAIDMDATALPNHPYLFGVLTTLAKDAAPKFLNALSPETWKLLRTRVFHDERQSAAEHLDVLVFAVERNLVKPKNMRWQAFYAEKLCNQPALRMATLAQWIYSVFTTSEMMVMLGPSVLAWRNRCIEMNSYPLPRVGSAVAECYGMKHALATLLAVGSPAEVVEAFDALSPIPPMMYHVLNST
jgi:hypothetical protein